MTKEWERRVLPHEAFPDAVLMHARTPSAAVLNMLSIRIRRDWPSAGYSVCTAYTIDHFAQFRFKFERSADQNWNAGVVTCLRHKFNGLCGEFDNEHPPLCLIHKELPKPPALFSTLQFWSKLLSFRSLYLLESSSP